MVTLKKSKKELWEGLQAYHFDNLVPIHLADRVLEMFGGNDASTKAFASKLSRKLGWTAEFALRAITEYKKYVYLGVISYDERHSFEDHRSDLARTSVVHQRLSRVL